MTKTKAPWFRDVGPSEPSRRREIPKPYRGGSEKYGMDRDRGREKRRERRQPDRSKPGWYKPYDTPGRKPAAPPKPALRLPSKPTPLNPVPLIRNPRLPGLLRRAFGAANRFMDAADLLDYLREKWKEDHGKYPVPYPSNAAGWVKCGQCPTLSWTQANTSFWNSSNVCPQAIHTQANNCLSGQASPGPGPIPPPIVGNANSRRTIGYNIAVFNKTLGVWRETRIATWYRQVGDVTKTVPQFIPSWTGQPDPNVLRAIPMGRNPKILQPGHARGLPDISNPAAMPYEPDLQYQAVAQPGYSDLTVTAPSLTPRAPSGPSTVGPGRPGQGSRPPATPPVVRAPPPAGEKQAKVISKTRAVGVAVWRGLDAMSETAELISAVYDALPADVRKRWDRPARQGDTFGQYGLDGADWKAQAIWHNLHRLDVVQALKNIARNGLSDSVIGGMQRGLPRNAGNAHSQGEKELAEWLDDMFATELGL